MRKNSPRKWLHAILDLLPVLILPIFALAVRSDNNFQPIEVQAQDYEVVDFNQLIIDGKPNSINYYDLDGDYSSFTLTGDHLQFIGNENELNLVYSQFFRIEPHKYYISFEMSSPRADTEVSISDDMDLFYQDGFILVNRYQKFNFIKDLTILSAFEETSFFTFNFYNDIYDDLSWILFKNFQVFDLTQMFGSGNEPTIEQFKNYFPNDYYEYTTSKKELLNVGTTTLSDTDVGSQMVYTLYNATDKYFNMNSVFNLNSVWSWIQLNIFNGNTPLVAYVIWQVIIYEFIVDILFIFYSFFMFLIDFCEYLLEKPFNKINRGK